METKLREAVRRTHLGATAADWRIIYDAIAEARAAIQPWGTELTRTEEHKLTQWRYDKGLRHLEPKEAAAINAIAANGWIEEIADSRYYQVTRPSSWRKKHQQALDASALELGAAVNEPKGPRVGLKRDEALVQEIAQLQSDLAGKMAILALRNGGNIEAVSKMFTGAEFLVTQTGEKALASIASAEVKSADGTQTLRLTAATQTRWSVISDPETPLIGSGTLEQ